MYLHCLRLTLLTFVVLAFRFLIVRIPFEKELLPSKDKDAESILARGEKISISVATQSDLELIPGMGESKALALLKVRKELLNAEPKRKELEACKLLEEVKGVGKKNCLGFLNYLEIN